MTKSIHEYRFTGFNEVEGRILAMVPARKHSGFAQWFKALKDWARVRCVSREAAHQHYREDLEWVRELVEMKIAGKLGGTPWN